MGKEERIEEIWENLQHEEFKKLSKQHPNMPMTTLHQWSCDYAQKNYVAVYDAEIYGKYLDMYGCTPLDMEDMLHEDMPCMLAMSILSDAQHVMSYDQEQARQFINRAKYVIRHIKSDSGLVTTPTTNTNIQTN